MGALGSVIGRLLNPRNDLSWLSHDPGFDRADTPPPPPEPLETPRARSQRRALLGNGSLWIGGIIVLGLFVVVLFGPVFAPENPYLAGTRTISYNEQGQIITPPYPPSDQFPLGTDPWGKDILSLLLYGTRNTLVASAFITMARLLIGLLLGATAGWNEGKLTDRAIMGLVGLTTALPTLIASMILIFALDISKGLPVFIVALSVVGWAEIAQYIRSEFIVLKQRPFIEGAHAAGLPGLDIAVRHILPNVLPQLIIITLLEMGAVLMLLGELGFVQVFIGGGIQSTNAADQAIIIPSIPEWGAMMADARRFARAKPWMVIYPAGAFFLAVVGFNALGEGLRRLIETVEVNTNVLLSKRSLLFAAALSAATVYIIQTVGPAPSYARLAQDFDADAAYRHVQALVDFEGRGNGQPGGQAAADYIAAKFEEYGLFPAGRGGTYFYSYPTRLVQPLAQPSLDLLAESGQPAQSFRHQLDFGFAIDGHGGSGEVQAPLTFVGFDAGLRRIAWADYQGLDLRGQIVLAFADNAPPGFATEALIRGAEGVIWIVEDSEEAVRSQLQLADDDKDYLRKPNIPMFKVRPPIAEQLAGAHALADLRAMTQVWETPERPWHTVELGTEVGMSVTLSEPEETELVNVIGRLAGQDIALDSQYLAVTAHYDGLGQDPDGTVFPAANDNASGTALLLEVARLWHERDFTPRRNVFFIAWGGANLDVSGAAAFAESPPPNMTVLTLVGVMQLNNLGAGGEELLITGARGRLAGLIEDSARQVDQPITASNQTYHAYQGIIAAGTPSVLISRPESRVSIENDSLDRIDPLKLSAAGELINLIMITMSREPTF